jgi:hypothetical protein
MLWPQHNQAQRKGQKKEKENNALWRGTLKFSPFISRCEVSGDGININLI